MQATVGKKTETILVTSAGLPLYYYLNDTAAKSAVTGGLAALWPPLTSASPAATGLTGKLAAVTDTHGNQVAYNGHLLYTFADDQPGQVTGQGVRGFFVATPGLTPITGSSTAGSSTTAGTAPSLPPATLTATEAARRPGPLAPFHGGGASDRPRRGPGPSRRTPPEKDAAMATI